MADLTATLYPLPAKGPLPAPSKESLPGYPQSEQERWFMRMADYEGPLGLAAEPALREYYLANAP